MTGATRYYRHFKGGKYKVLAIGQDSESLAPVNDQPQGVNWLQYYKKKEVL